MRMTFEYFRYGAIEHLSASVEDSEVLKQMIGGGKVEKKLGKAAVRLAKESAPKLLTRAVVESPCIFHHRPRPFSFRLHIELSRVNRNCRVSLLWPQANEVDDMAVVVCAFPRP
jgi:hypothetical protein